MNYTAERDISSGSQFSVVIQTVTTTTLTPPGGETNKTNDDVTVGASAGLIGAVIFIVVIIIIIVIRKRMHRSSSESDSEIDMDSLDDVTVSLKGDDRDASDVLIVDGNKVSRRKLKGEFWVEDEKLRSIIKMYIIESSHIDLIKILGKGQYGCVYEAKLAKDARASNDYGNLTHEKVAVKTLRGSNMSTELAESFLSEGLLMKDFKHKHVLGFIGVSFGKDDVPMIILPFMSNGNLKNYISKSELQMTVRDLLKFAHQAALGMEYLASQKFVHRDLAARNCMLDDDMVLKVADFGLSRDIYTKEYYSSEDKKAKLPVKWMAVESLTKNLYTTKSDVWSFGVLLWELMTRGVTPYPDVSNWDIRSYVISGRRLDKPDACPAELYNIMKRCWKHDPKLRPTFNELASELHEILDWDSTNSSDDYDTLYVNVESNSPPSSPV